MTFLSALTPKERQNGEEGRAVSCKRSNLAACPNARPVPCFNTKDLSLCFPCPFVSLRPGRLGIEVNASKDLSLSFPPADGSWAGIPPQIEAEKMITR